MLWLGLAILIIGAGYFYLKHKNSVTLNNEDARVVSDLLSKETKVLADQMHDNVDEAALKGEVFSLDNFAEKISEMPDEVRKAFINIKQDLLEKYGPTIPTNIAHRIFFELEGEGKMWSDWPGCFERHLQRRDGSLLFPPGRRIVLRKEIEEAIEKDRIEADSFLVKYNSLADKQIVMFENMKDVSNKDAQAHLQEMMQLIHESAALGESVEAQRLELEEVERTLIDYMGKSNPALVELLKKQHIHSKVLRLDYLVQFNREDSPILRDELVPTLLSEDDKYIVNAAVTCKKFGIDELAEDDDSRKRPDRLPSTNDIKLVLKDALMEGFSQARADRIMEAWNEGLMYVESHREADPLT